MHTSRDPDLSNGWEAVAQDFIAASRQSDIGVATVQDWARALPPGGAVLDLGCGPGVRRSEALFRAGCSVYAVDAAPSMARAYQHRFPTAQVACEAVEDSAFFGRTFDAALAWGLLFLLSPNAQRTTIHRIAAALKPGARLLFTAPVPVGEWADLSTGRPSHSLGDVAYRALLADAQLALAAEHVDEGENHYYDAVKQ